MPASLGMVAVSSECVGEFKFLGMYAPAREPPHPNPKDRFHLRPIVRSEWTFPSPPYPATLGIWDYARAKSTSWPWYQSQQFLQTLAVVGVRASSGVWHSVFWQKTPQSTLATPRLQAVNNGAWRRQNPQKANFLGALRQTKTPLRRVAKLNLARLAWPKLLLAVVRSMASCNFPQARNP